jgi:hypothetical protein
MIGHLVPALNEEKTLRQLCQNLIETFLQQLDTMV